MSTSLAAHVTIVDAPDVLVIIDTGTSSTRAKASLDLFRRETGNQKPVVAVIYPTVTYIPPTDSIVRTGEKRELGGWEFEFLYAPDTEAPEEMAGLGQRQRRPVPGRPARHVHVRLRPVAAAREPRTDAAGGERASDLDLRINCDFTDVDEQWTMWIRNGVLNARRGHVDDAQLTVSGPKPALAGPLLQPDQAKTLVEKCDLQHDGDLSVLDTLASVIDTFNPHFNIATP